MHFAQDEKCKAKNAIQSEATQQNRSSFREMANAILKAQKNGGGTCFPGDARPAVLRKKPAPAGRSGNL